MPVSRIRLRMSVSVASLFCRCSRSAGRPVRRDPDGFTFRRLGDVLQVLVPVRLPSNSQLNFTPASRDAIHVPAKL